ncbi:MAG: oligosaccharide flippase family protein [Solirubrobacteraceae bacterium]
MRLLRVHKSVTFNALSLMTATVATNALGLVFWTFAARLDAPRIVGRAAAAVAALTLLATISQLNLTNVFIRLLPSAGRLGWRLIARGYLAVIALSLLVGAVYVASGLGASVVQGGLLAQAAFVAAVPVLAIFALQDSVLTALRRAPWVAIENISFATGKLALLPALVLLPIGGAIVISWVVPAAVAVIVISALLFWRVLRAVEHTEGTLPARRRLMSFVAGEYMGAIWATATTQVMPLILVWRLGTAQVAYFTLPWLISMGITVLLWNVASAFVVELAGAHEHSSALLHRTLMLWAGVVTGAMLVCVVGAGPLLSLAGASYAAHGTELLRLIGCAAPFTALVAVYCTLMWIDKRVWLLAAFQAASGVALLSLTLVLLPHLGLVAVGWANLAVQALAAVATLPLSVRRLRTGLVAVAG